MYRAVDLWVPLGVPVGCDLQHVDYMLVAFSGKKTYAGVSIIEAMFSYFKLSHSIAMRGSALLRTSATFLTEGVELVKQLRGRTGAPITEVKAALAETGWDIGKLCLLLARTGGGVSRFSCTSPSSKWSLNPVANKPLTHLGLP